MFDWYIGGKPFFLGIYGGLTLEEYESSMSAYSFLLKNSYGIYHFRMVVPKRFRSPLQLREVKRSLHTKSHHQAMRLARRYAALLELLFEQQVVTKADLSGCLQEVANPSSRPFRQQSIASTENAQASTSVSLSSQPTPAKPSHGFPFLGEVMDRFIKHQKLSNAWNQRTMEGYLAVFESVKEILGDLPIDLITYETAEQIRDIIVQLPPNRLRSPKWKNLSIEAILKKKPMQTMASKTVNQYLVRTSALFEWAVNRNIVQVNPFKGLKIRTKQKAADQRKAFSTKDIIEIFDPKNFTTDPRRPSRYWIPVIAAYTGLRMEEIAQLEMGDIKEIEGVLCFDINDDGEKKLKTLNSVRLVPVHSELLKLGLMEYVESIKFKKKEKRLFFDLTEANGKLSHNFSKWFARYRQQCGITEPGKTFHSFRHTVATIWKQLGVHESIPATLLGHSAGGITYTRYGKGYDVKQLAKVIEMIHYEEGMTLVPWK